MTTLTKPKRQRKKPERFIRRVLAPSPVNPFSIVNIRVGKEAADYRIEPIPADFGQAFEVQKLGESESYHVNQAGLHSSCECLGYLRWNHCKHLEGIAALQKAGQL